MRRISSSVNRLNGAAAHSEGVNVMCMATTPCKFGCRLPALVRTLPLVGRGILAPLCPQPCYGERDRSARTRLEQYIGVTGVAQRRSPTSGWVSLADILSALDRRFGHCEIRLSEPLIVRVACPVCLELLQPEVPEWQWL